MYLGFRRNTGHGEVGRRSFRTARLRRSWLTAALSLSLSLPLWGLAGPARAEAQLFVADTVPFALRDAADPGFTVIVHAAAPLTNLRVTVRELKDPDGQSLSPALLTATPEAGQVTEQGTRVRFKPDLGGLVQPGEYTAVVLFQAGQGAAPVSLLRTLTLRRERASLSPSLPSGVTVRLVRPTPWRPAQRTIALSLDNNGRTEIHDLAIESQGVLTEGAAADAVTPRPGGAGPSASPSLASSSQAATEIAPGSVTVVLPPPPPGLPLQRERSGRGLTVAPGGRLDFSLLLSEWSAVGRYRTGVSLRAPALGSPQPVALTVEVTDRWPFPLAALAGGALLGLLVNLLLGRGRKGAENRARIAYLSNELEGLHGRASGPQSSAALARMSDELRRASERNQQGEVALATALLDEIDARIERWSTQQAERRAAVRERFEHAQALSAALLQRRAALTTEHLVRLKDARVGLVGTSALLQSDQVEQAETVLRPALEQLQGLGQVLRGQENTADIEALLQDRPRPLRIEVTPAPAQRTVGADLTFLVHDERPDRQSAELYQWRFRLSDALPRPSGEPIEGDADKGTQVARRFVQPGDVTAQLTVRRPDGTDAATANCYFTVHPVRAGVDLRAVQSRSLRVALVISAVSLPLATASGLLFLYVDRVFGTGTQYLVAGLWGLGVDAALRGFGALVRRVEA